MQNLAHNNSSALGQIWVILNPRQRKTAIVLLALMVVGMALEMLGIGLVIPAILVLTQENPVAEYPQLQSLMTSLGNPSRQLLIIGGMTLLVAVYLIKSLYLGFLAWRQTRFAFNVQAELSQRLFTTYLRQPYTFHLQHNSAYLIRNAITEVAVFNGSALCPGLLLITEGLVLFGIALLLFAVEPLGTLVVVAVLGIATWGFHRGTRASIARWGEARQHHEGLRLQHLQQGLGGVKEVILRGCERDFLAQYDRHNKEGARVAGNQVTLRQFPRLFLELLAVVGLALLVLTMLAQGREAASIVPTLGLFAVAAFRLMPSVTRVLGTVQSLRYGLPVINTLYRELSLGRPDLTRPGEQVNTPFEKEIRLTDVCYNYPEASRAALNQISLTIKKGESVGFIGPSGSGKSSMVDVILGLLIPDSGLVQVDGKEIQQDLRGWQQQVGYVPQSIYLTDDSLRRNVAFGLSSGQIDEAAVQRAIRDAQLEDLVNSLPEGLETLVGEHGVRLSGGQRQRIGIARALYHDPIVLVLDEATSSLDSETERSVMQAVMSLRDSKTILIIAHRLSTVEHCDRLYRLEQGQIVEEGSLESMSPVKKIAK